jgi:hypothetical protein
MLPSWAGTRLADGLPPQEANMSQQTLTNRVEVLERKVESLEKLPERMDLLELQFLHFREEVRAEFSATRAELRAEIRAGDEETRTYMRVLHEEVLSRIALLDEHRNGSARFRPTLKSPKRRKKR